MAVRGGDMPICVKTLLFRFLTTPVTWKLETAEDNERIIFYNCSSYRPCLVGMASTPSHQYSWLKMAKTAVFR